ncbi:hypothetical protein BCR34DRAFT_584449 [Clohesyomyces aquaticus]|uniref:Uncharacterized protein n=1 Tax=Clohesyomyces aquaticus TaxID=1231657 RepID=A0A1Y2A124_9PLEO|nr:hypothetical protein BCR34DRAFT_584449 [Clohesyomyces aquaticus]
MPPRPHKGRVQLDRTKLRGKKAAINKMKSPNGGGGGGGNRKKGSCTPCVLSVSAVSEEPAKHVPSEAASAPTTPMKMESPKSGRFEEPESDPEQQPESQPGPDQLSTSQALQRDLRAALESSDACAIEESLSPSPVLAKTSSSLKVLKLRSVKQIKATAQTVTGASVPQSPPKTQASSSCAQNDIPLSGTHQSSVLKKNTLSPMVKWIVQLFAGKKRPAKKNSAPVHARSLVSKSQNSPTNVSQQTFNRKGQAVCFEDGPPPSLEFFGVWTGNNERRKVQAYVAGVCKPKPAPPESNLSPTMEPAPFDSPVPLGPYVSTFGPPSLPRAIPQSHHRQQSAPQKPSNAYIAPSFLDSQYQAGGNMARTQSRAPPKPFQATPRRRVRAPILTFPKYNVGPVLNPHPACKDAAMATPDLHPGMLEYALRNLASEAISPAEQSRFEGLATKSELTTRLKQKKYVKHTQRLSKPNVNATRVLPAPTVINDLETRPAGRYRQRRSVNPPWNVFGLGGANDIIQEDEEYEEDEYAFEENRASTTPPHVRSASFTLGGDASYSAKYSSSSSNPPSPFTMLPSSTYAPAITPIIVQAGRPTSAELTALLPPNPYIRPWGRPSDPTAKLAIDNAISSWDHSGTPSPKPLLLTDAITPAPDLVSAACPPTSPLKRIHSWSPVKMRKSMSSAVSLSAIASGSTAQVQQPKNQQRFRSLSTSSDRAIDSRPIHLTPNTDIPTHPALGSAAYYRAMTSCPYFAFDQRGYVLRSRLAGLSGNSPGL